VRTRHLRLHATKKAKTSARSATIVWEAARTDDTRSQLWALAYCDPDSNIFNSVLGHLQPECADVHAEMKSAAQNVYEREQEAKHNERAKVKDDKQKKRKEQERIERETARNKV